MQNKTGNHYNFSSVHLYSFIFVTLLLGLVPSANFSAAAGNKAGRSPLDELGSHIKQVTTFGQRADWSHDGKRILFLEKTYGDVYEVELETGKLRALSHHYYHSGYTRALYLANGDILLSGARLFDPENPGASRNEKKAELWVLKKDLSGPPVPLGEHCCEGPAVSRKNMYFAWTYLQDFYMADVVYKNGKPELANKKKLKRQTPFKANYETQNFRPPYEKELIFTAYGYQGTEVAGLNLETGEVVNYSKAPNQYDESEGIFPDGRHTLIECNKHMAKPEGIQEIDIYKLALDGSARIERLTHFADYPGYKATNPVVSDDGRFMAFHYGKKGDKAGVGRGIIVFDLEMYERMKRK